MFRFRLKHDFFHVLCLFPLPFSHVLVQGQQLHNFDVMQVRNEKELEMQSHSSCFILTHLKLIIYRMK